jgi:acetyl esterase/lipase
MYEQEKSLGIDPRHIVVMGESAGGGLAAMLAGAAKERRGPPIALQALVYPMLDDRTGSTHAAPDVAGRFIWTAQNNRFGWSALLGVPAGSSYVPPGAVPARLNCLEGLPPVWIGCGALDLLLEENLEYARRLIASGVPTELHVVPRACHGFYNMAPFADLTIEFRQQLVNALERALKAP